MYPRPGPGCTSRRGSPAPPRGTRASRSSVLYRHGTGGTPPDLKLFDVASREAVEVYRSPAEAPVEFGGEGAECGTIVLWTRRG
jgi:hypothetical protein